MFDTELIVGDLLIDADEELIPELARAGSPHLSEAEAQRWWALRGSNPRPSDYESPALTD